MSYTQHVQVSLYNGHLVIEYLTQASVENEVVSPYDSSSMGYIIHDTRHVTITQEAYDALAAIRPGRDSLGELDVFLAGDGKYVFGTFGGMYTIFNIKNGETSRQFKVPAASLFNIAEVETPEGAKQAIDNNSEDEDE